MKQLARFTQFDAESFLSNLILMAMKTEVLLDFDTKEELGSKWTIVIWEDNHDYGNDDVTNVGETFTVKLLGKKPRELKKPSIIEIIDPIGKVYGEYRNQLVITADDITIID